MSFSGCATPTTVTATRTVHDFCLIAQHGISYAEQHAGDAPESAVNAYDTADTIAEVKEFNVRYQRTCPAPAPVATP